MMNCPTQDFFYTNNIAATPLPITSALPHVSTQGAIPVNLVSYLLNTTPVVGKAEE